MLFRSINREKNDLIIKIINMYIKCYKINVIKKYVDEFLYVKKHFIHENTYNIIYINYTKTFFHNYAEFE